MKYRYYKMLSGLLIGSLLLSGCGSMTVATETQASENYQTEQSVEINTSKTIAITLDKNQISADSNDVKITDSTLTITKEGTYILSGTLENGSIIVDAKGEEVQLVLNGVSIQSDTFGAIYVKQADKVVVTLAEGTENVLANGGSFTQIDSNNVDAVIFSKDDITFNGNGSLSIQSPGGHGIVGKDEVTIAGGIYEITSSKVSIRANDGIAISEGTFLLRAGTDGLHAEKNGDESLGSIYIAGGNFDITAGDDGIHATTTLQVDGGNFKIKAAEGMEATNITLNDGDISIEASDDGINAAKKSSLYPVKITVNGGNISVVMGAGDTDGFDANGDIEINGGYIQVTGKSTFDYDGKGVMNGGTVIVNGEPVTELSSQMMGGHGGKGGMIGGVFGDKVGGKEGMTGDRTDKGGMNNKDDKSGRKSEP